jgi:flagellar basal-body rod protein FlgG
MMDALNAAATGMDAKTQQMDTISNNIANSDTTGFKRSRAEFQDLLYRNVKDPGAATSATTLNPTGIQVGAGVRVTAVSREHEQGSPRHTGRDLDLCINGPGFLAVQKGDGEIAYTRDGNLHLDAEGRVVTSSGYPLEPEITLPQGITGLAITEDGRVQVRTGNGPEIQEVGQIQITTFANPAGLASQGGNLYAVSPSSGAPAPGTPGDGGSGRLMQQYLESSNVSSVTEMTDMIRAQRGYELNSKVISTASDMMATLNQLK